MNQRLVVTRGILSTVHGDTAEEILHPVLKWYTVDEEAPIVILQVLDESLFSFEMANGWPRSF